MGWSGRQAADRPRDSAGAARRAPRAPRRRGGLLPVLLPQRKSRKESRGGVQTPRLPGVGLARDSARVSRIRAHLDHGDQCLFGAGDEPLSRRHAGARERGLVRRESAEQGCSRTRARDAVERWNHLGRKSGARAGDHNFVRARGRRDRSGLCRGTRAHRQSDRLRHGGNVHRRGAAFRRIAHHQ